MRSVRTLVFASLVGASSLTLLVAPGAARAEPPGTVDVGWTAPDDCPSGAELQRRVASRIPADVGVRARGKVERRGARYRVALDIETASSRGERVLDAASCDALATSAAAVIAISATTATPPSSVAPPVAAAATADGSPSDAGATDGNAAAISDASPPPSLPPSSTPPAPAPRGEEERAAGDTALRTHLFLRGHAVVDVGLLPSATVGGGVAIGLVTLRRLSIEAAASLFASQDGTASGAADRGASFSLFSSGLRACWSLTSRYEIAPCLGVEVVRVGGSGFGAARVADASAVFGAPTADLAGRLPLVGPLFLRFGVGALVPTSRQSFVIVATGAIHRAGAVAFRGFLGPEVHF